MTNDNNQAQPSGSSLIAIYERAARIRKNDEAFHGAMQSGKLGIRIYYSPRGQEIIPSALCDHLTDADYLVTIYRGVHDQIAKGIPLKALWAEYAGRVTGTCKGKGGPMHVTHPASGNMVTTGIVGGSLPIANGLALASQLDKDQRVTVACFGDGASNIGAFHESLNMASLWKLPVIFLCQNNLIAEHTRFEKGTAVARVADRAAAYNMHGIHVNGNDPKAMWVAAKEAVDRARSGKGPTLIEAMTFRFMGHLIGDPDEHWREGEKEAALERDPVPALRAMLISEGHATEDELIALERNLDEEIEEAMAFAAESPKPDPKELNLDVLAGGAS
ncbi:MAG: thiamine pyrophosphate-dependent dehydrogenase E1 component subunit alpha [Pseudomonadota bacterium]